MCDTTDFEIETLNYDDVTQFMLEEITCLFLYDLAAMILVRLV